MMPHPTKLSLFTVLTFLLAAVHAASSDMPQTNPTTSAFKKAKKVMGYYPAYNHRLQSPSQIPWSLYSDVTFFVAIPELDGTFTYPPGLTPPLAEKLAGEFVKEATSHHVFPIMSFGGYTGSKHFSVMCSNADSRVKYAKILINFAKKFGFKGMDLDWEFPNDAGIGCNNFTASDTVNFGLFVQEIRKQWPSAQLTAALSIKGLIGASGGPATAEEVKLLAQNLDFVLIMAYDVFGTWSDTTGPLAPLHTSAPDVPVSVETSITTFLEQGFAIDQMIMGIPAYARSYELTSPELTPRTLGNCVSYYFQNQTGIAPPGGESDDRPMIDVCGVHASWGGIWLVKELMEKCYLSADQLTGENGYKRHWDSCTGQPFLTNGKYFFSYDDHISIASKAAFSKQKNLAGIFFFDTEGQPDFAIKAGINAFE